MPQTEIEPDFKRAERNALSLISELGYLHPPIDPEDVARALGIDVTFATFAAPFDQEVSGFFDPENNEIVINEKEYPKRQTFTIAHEIGHYRLHRDHLMSDDYGIVMRSSELKKNRPPEEREADAFAANLLVPRPFLERYKSIATVKELSDLFMVSIPVIRNRLKIYGESTAK